MKLRKEILLLVIILFSIGLAACTSENLNDRKSNTQEKTDNIAIKNDNPTVETGSDKQDKNSINSNSDWRKPSDNKVAIRIGEEVFTVNLYDNPTAEDLYAQLPLRLKANDYAGYDEKVIRLSDSLSMKGAPDGDEPEIPEVGYYEPGQWIALYYGPIGYWPGKVPLGQINASVEELRAIPDNASLTIETVRD